VSTPLTATASASAAGAATATAAEDLGPLAWVLSEVQKSLDGAGKLLRRFARETGNVPEIDGGALRMARAQLHQAVGALQMVGHVAPARVLGAMEFAVQSFVLEPARCTDAAVQKIERAGFAVADYLQALLGGKQVSPVALFSQYRDVLDLVGNERVHPADLWPQPWRWVDMPRPAAATTLVYDPAVRSKLDREVLKVVRSGDDLAARRLHELCLGLARGATQRQVAAFWTLSAAFFEALGLALVPADVYAKRAASRVLLQYATLARGDNTVSERLAQDMLFFCAQAVPGTRDDATTLRAVRSAWGLSEERAVDYTTEQFGRFDPVVLAQARKRIESAKEMWSALSGGDVTRLRQVADTFGQLSESLQKLHPSSQPMAQALTNAVESSARSGKPPSTELAMEVATSVLYLEAAFEDLDPHDRQLTARTVQLAGRIARASESGRSEPLEPWMEELYRRVSDRQSMGTVVDELRVHLSELEKSLDQFFRRPEDKSLLRAVPTQLLQMRGVFSVLGLDAAALTVQRMRDNVERLMAGDASSEASTSDFDSLGNNLGALGFLNDMLGYQPSLAKRLFVFDAEAGELKPLMGRQAADAEPEAKAPPVQVETTAAAAPVVAADSVLSAKEIDAEIAKRLAALGAKAKAAASPIDDFGAAAESWTTKITGPATLTPLENTEVTELEEDDLQDIFLEEAREVLHNGAAAIETLTVMPDNMGELTILRRAFHTLKGSSRMVGLTEFGEAAWAFEQVLNTWLADQKPATPHLLAGTTRALGQFAGWVEAIASGQPHSWQTEPFLKAAEQLASGVSAGLAELDADALAVAARQIAADEVPAAPMPSLPDLELDAPATKARSDAPTTAPAPLTQPLVDDFPSTDFLDFDGKPVAAPSHSQVTLEGAEDLDFLSTQHAPIEPAFEPTSLALPREFEDEAPFNFDIEPVAKAEPEPAPVPEVQEPVEAAAPQVPEPPVEVEAPDVIEPVAQGEQTGVAEAGPDVEPEPEVVAEVEPAIQPEAEVLAEAEPEFESAANPELVAEAGPEPEREPERVAEAEPEPEPELVAEAESEPVPQAEPEPEAAAQGVSQTEPEFESAVEPVAQAPADAIADAPGPEPEAVELLQLEEPEAELVALQSGADDAVKAIGPLRIGIALYNVYLNEADEWSRQLAHEVGEWALEPHTPVADSTVALAHSLAGSSATVGFQSLSSMARLFEAALQHLHMQGSGTAAQGIVLIDAADELRRLLHQFAAGFLREPSPQTLDALREVAASAEAPSQPEAVAEPLHLVLPARSTPLPQGADVALDDSEDAIDLEDAVDPDLFEVFEEEAGELLPELSSALRQWTQTPEDNAPRSSVLRTLHTLKGSARLAGAMKLGERAHRMESEIELLGSSNVQRADIERLLGRFDAMQATFDGLRVAEDAAGTDLSRTAPQAAADAKVEAQPEAKPAASTPVVAEVAEDDATAESAGAVVAASEPAPVRAAVALPTPSTLAPLRQVASQAVRIRTHLLDRLVAQAGEVIITRSRLEVELGQLRSSLHDLTGNLDRLRTQLRDIEVQAESQMQSRLAQAKDSQQGFDPLEFDRFTRVQELTRMMAESVNDVATVQRTLQKTVQATEDDLSAQARQTRELQRGLLRTRMVEFEGISERLYRVVRQASKDTGKQIKLDITGGTIEMDRGVLDRMTPAFEHLLRNCVAHGIEDVATRERAGKDAAGLIAIDLSHEGNDVSVTFRDDGAGLDPQRIAERARALGLIERETTLSADEAVDMIFRPGFSTAAQVSELAGRGIGMDVVRSDVAALGGRIETHSTPGSGTSFKLVLPLTTAVTHVVMMRVGDMSVGVPSNLVELVQRSSQSELETAYVRGHHMFSGEQVPFYWGGALLQSSARSERALGKHNTIVIVRSAAQRVALHVDEVLGNQEVVVKNLGPQLSRLPGMAGISVLASGAVALIYNPVALAAVHGESARALQNSAITPAVLGVKPAGAAVVPTLPAPAAQVPLVLVVDDSITVRRVTQRLLQREGYRVALAADGLQALSRLAEERPAVVLSDIEMPRMDGFDLARNIRADESLAGLPIIMITSRIAEKHREHAKQLGVNHYLGKPYSEEELLRLVRGYVSAPALAAAAA